MANPTIIPKKTSVAGRVPTASDLAIGEIAINHADGILYSRRPSGEVYALNSGSAPADNSRFWSFAISGNYLYLGSLLTSDFPQSGSIYDVTTWDITRTTTNAAGEIVSEASATGAWSSKTSLQFS